jgi:hypothetical protein
MSADCSTTTPAWLDELARRLGDQERAWMERRIHDLCFGNFIGDKKAEAERLRLQDELSAGYRSCSSAVVR